MQERVKAQLGRKPQGCYQVQQLCPWGYPLVLKTHPYKGAISPTLYWLACPYLVKAVSSLEAEGLIGYYTKRLSVDKKLNKALLTAHKNYAKERSSYIEEDAPLSDKVKKKLVESGIGGSELQGVKCLHMHLAHFLCTGQNPIGEEVWSMISPWQETLCPQNCPPIPPLNKKPKAVIDVGSNTCRLLIAASYPRPLPGPVLNHDQTGFWQAIYQETTTTEAGNNLLIGKQKTKEALERYLQVISRSGAELVLGVATGIWRREGICESSLKVISGDLEAKYSFLGATNSLSLQDQVTVVDLGGDSMEIITGQGEKIQSLKSFQLGFWSVAKTLDLKIPPTIDELLLVEQLVKDQLKTSKLTGKLVFIGGTATTLAGLALGLKDYDSNKIHGYHLDLKKQPEFSNLPYWAKEREKNLPIGYQILKTTAECAGENSAFISDIGLMGGILTLKS